MSKPRVEDVVREIAEPVADALGLELVDVEYIKEGGSWFLRIYIDKPQGINHEDCQSLARKVSDILDGKDPIPYSYTMEVSSPGIERPLKKPCDFVKFKGRKIRASTFAAIDGQKEFAGVLEGLEDEKILINSNGKQFSLPLDAVARVRLDADFNHDKGQKQ